MTKKTTSILAAIAVAIVTLMSGAGAASAGNVTFEFRFGTHQAPHMYVSPHRHMYKYQQPKMHRGFCKPRKAVKKARRKFGMHHARVLRVNNRKVVVRGYRHGHRIKVAFANQRGCPVIAKRVSYR